MRSLFFACALLLAGCATESARPRCTQDPATDAHAFAQRLDALEAALALEDSATRVLGAWCESLELATAAQLQALPEPLHDEATEATGAARARALLGVGPDEPLAHRRVRLACGGSALSLADNWYLPARLDAAMNATLESGHEPFGRVVAPLHFHRERLGSERDWSAPAPPPAAVDAPVLAQRARLVAGDGRAFSYVEETYLAAALSLSASSACR